VEEKTNETSNWPSVIVIFEEPQELATSPESVDPVDRGPCDCRDLLDLANPRWIKDPPPPEIGKVAGSPLFDLLVGLGTSGFLGRPADLPSAYGESFPATVEVRAANPSAETGALASVTIRRLGTGACRYSLNHKEIGPCVWERKAVSWLHSGAPGAPISLQAVDLLNLSRIELFGPAAVDFQASDN
jgi:hypothetical protein